MQPQYHKIILPPVETLGPEKRWELRADNELRLVVDAMERVSISLVSGKVEIFGLEITIDQPVIINNSRVAVYAVKDSIILVSLNIRSK